MVAATAPTERPRADARRAGVAIALGTAAISGVAVFVNGYGVRRFGDATVYTTAKNLVAATVLVVVLAARRRAAPEPSARAPRGRLAVAVLGGSVPFVLFFEGLARASSVSAAFLHKTLVVWVALLAWPVLRERAGTVHVAAIGLLVAGQAGVAGDVGVHVGSGEALVLGATLLWAVETVVAKRLLATVAPASLGVARMGGGGLLLLAFLLVSGRLDDLLALGASQWAWAALTGGLLAGYVATWYAALRLAGAIDVTAVLVAGALVTAGLDAIVRGAPVGADLPGLALIAAGVAAAVLAGRTPPAPLPRPV